MRELVTIGDLGTVGPNARSALRRANYLRLATGVRGIGQTNPNFVPGATSTTAGPELSQAGVDLLDYLDANGVPSEHASDQHVEDFQIVWNRDAANASHNSQLAVDGGYGPNVQSALAALVGDIAPHVNTGGAPAPAPTPATPATPAAPAVVPPAPVAQAGMGGGPLILLLAIAAAVGYALFGRKKGARASVTIRKNPRRGRGRRAYL